MGRHALHLLYATAIIVSAAGQLAAGDTIQFDTNTGAMLINGSPASDFFGVPMQSSVINGVMQFRFLGDLAFIPSDNIGASGSRPLSIFAGNDVRVPAGTVFNFDIYGPNGKLGGGSGGGAVSGGNGGAKGNGYVLPIIGGAGGAGGPYDLTSLNSGDDGSNGSVGQPGSAGTAGSLGTAGNQGAGGFNNVTGARAAGSAGSPGAGAPGATGGGGTGEDGGAAASLIGQGENGTAGGTGNAGGQGGQGTQGGPGGHGLGGLHLTTGLVISGGAGGSSGGSGGGGGGGAGGSAGGGGGGGGGGGAGGTLFYSEDGAGGGLGGFGGVGGSGGNGATGQGSGSGGAGGGGVEIVAQGRFNFGGSISIRGASAFAQPIAASPQNGSGGSSGTVGFPGGTSTTGIGGDGGAGGKGGTGGAGGNGGAAGAGGEGGGGAGGTIMFKSTLFSAEGGTITTVGGGSNVSLGGDGRYVTSDNGAIAPNSGTAIGTQREEYVGSAARDINPFISGGTTTTYNLVDLVGGADAYGVKSGVTYSSPYFTDIFGATPPGAIAAVVRRTVGPSDGMSNTSDEQYIGSDLLMLVNLTNGPLAAPTLGVGAGGSGFTTSLQTRGFAANPLFGGSGAQALTELGAGSVFATLVPHDAPFLAMEVNASLGGGSLTTTTFGDLNFSYIFAPNLLPGDFNNDHVVNLADYTVWRDNLGASSDTALSGNGNNVAGVDAGDYQLWKIHFGAQASTSSSVLALNVPEPACAISLLLGIATVARRLFPSRSAAE